MSLGVGLRRRGGRVAAAEEEEEEEEEEEFAEFASARLLRTAFLLCGDWHTAEDLTQTTLARMFVAAISRQEAAYAYASRTLVNAYLTDRRRREAGLCPVLQQHGDADRYGHEHPGDGGHDRGRYRRGMVLAP